jgi:hypothetical protein
VGIFYTYRVDLLEKLLQKRKLLMEAEEISEAIVDLFKEIQHGDQEHREWLQEKVKTWAWDQFWYCVNARRLTNQ